MGITKEVIKYDADGNEVARYKSVMEAASKDKILYDRINKCIKGKRKDVDGYTFKYSGALTNKVDHIGIGLPFKCPYCERAFETYNGLAQHIVKQKSHGNISSEQLLADYAYNGVRPKCKCGCGQYTEINHEAELQFRDFCRGHQARVNNNWGNNPIAVQHSSDTRRKQYKSGERIQWNKGKTWEETYTPEQITELMKQYDDTERNAKISNAFKGVPKSPEHAEKCREN
jgi:hypothetical protein